MKIEIILLIISIITFVISFVIYYKATKIEVLKSLQQENLKNELISQINSLYNEKNNLIQFISQEKESLNEELKQFQNNRLLELDQNFKCQKERINLCIQKENRQAEKQIEIIHEDLNKIRESSIKQKKQLKADLDKLKSSLNAGVEARLRDQQKKEKINFYKLSISDSDLADVEMLENLKSSFHKPVVLSKLIWTQYFQKQMTQLCDRVFGKKIVCGIYKITDLITEQCYIGQSVNIQQRMKQHCKCGLGIDAPVTNKLYNTMQRDKVWNFTFELLEQCPRESLNEKERFWIQMYQSNKFGLNTNKGVN